MQQQIDKNFIQTRYCWDVKCGVGLKFEMTQVLVREEKERGKGVLSCIYKLFRVVNSPLFYMRGDFKADGLARKALADGRTGRAEHLEISNEFENSSPPAAWRNIKSRIKSSKREKWTNFVNFSRNFKSNDKSFREIPQNDCPYLEMEWNSREK